MRMTILALLAIALCGVDPSSGGEPHVSATGPWWMTPHRMLQTNLREIDATMDLDQYVRDVKEFGADVVLFNVGGIVANYPTELEYHYRNPYIEGDLVGEVLRRLHAEGVRMIGRFDFSKINERFARERPEWLYKSEKGESVNYNGQVHTCVSGGYQQEYMFKILGEAIDRYPLDGVFFNMIGYTTRDYSGNEHGLCQCDACGGRFRDFCGMDLPPRRDPANPAYAKHQEFCRQMVARQFERVHDFLKGKRPDLAICTYTDTGVDVIRRESNRATAEWLYSDTDRARSTLLTHPDKMLANAAVHFLEIPHRHAGTSPYLTARRLLQQMFGGAWLDFYCIGPVHRLEDRMALDLVRGIFRFHAENEQWLADSERLADVGLVRRGGEEYEGLFQILAERHVPFDLASLDGGELARFAALIVPDAGGLDPASCRRLDQYVRGGGKLLISGRVPETLESLGTGKLLATHRRQKGMYLRIRPEDKARLARPPLDQVGLVYLDGDLAEYELDGSAEGLLRFVPPGMSGPPEKSYYTTKSDAPGLIVNRFGKGAAAAMPWPIGAHYRQLCHPAHAELVVGTLEGLLGLRPRVRVDASPLVEVTHHRDRKGRFEWVGLLNHSGTSANAIHPPIPLHNIEIEIEPRRPITSARLLAAGQSLDIQTHRNHTRCTLPSLNHYEVLLLQYAE